MADVRKIKREFQDIERKIMKLKEFERRFRLLDIKGFEDDAATIESKLKDPAAVSEVETKLLDLEKKLGQRQPEQKPENTEEQRKVIESLEKRITKLKELEKRFNALVVTGYEEQSEKIREKLKDPDSVEFIEEQIQLLETSIKDKVKVKTNSLGLAGKNKKEFEVLQRKIDKLKELEKRFDSLDIEGFESEAADIKAKIKDPEAADEIDKSLSMLEKKIVRRKKWKSHGAQVYDVSVKICAQGVDYFHDKNYEKARQEFFHGIEKFKSIIAVADQDEEMIHAVQANLLSAQRNIIACNLGQGNICSDNAKKEFQAGNYQVATENFRKALHCFTEAKDVAHEIKDKEKAASSNKYCSVMERNLQDCQNALDRERAASVVNNINLELSLAKENFQIKAYAKSTEKLELARLKVKMVQEIIKEKKYLDLGERLDQSVAVINGLQSKIDSMEAESKKINTLWDRLNAIDPAGFEDDYHSIKSLLEDCRPIPDIEIALEAFEKKVQQRDIWKTEGAASFDAAVKMCDEAIALFYNKEYVSALILFKKAVSEFSIARDIAGEDIHLQISIDDNITSAKRNIIACYLGLGAIWSESAQGNFTECQYAEAREKFETAISSFLAAKEIATEIKDEDKVANSTKLAEIMKLNIEDCFKAQDKESIATSIGTVNSLINEAQKEEIRKELKEAKDHLLQGMKICQDMSEIAKSREFVEELSNLDELIKTIRSKLGSLGKAPLPRIQEVSIDISIDDIG